MPKPKGFRVNPLVAKLRKLGIIKRRRTRPKTRAFRKHERERIARYRAAHPDYRKRQSDFALKWYYERRRGTDHVRSIWKKAQANRAERRRLRKLQRNRITGRTRLNAALEWIAKQAAKELEFARRLGYSDLPTWD